MANILVVDDHPLVLKGLSVFLKEKLKESNIYLAEDGLKALDIMSKVSIDIVILDLSLPKLSGIETLRRINSEFLDAKVLTMDIGANFQLIKESLSEGAFGFVSKELALNEITNAINEILKGNFYFQKEINDALLGEFKEYIKKEKKDFTPAEVRVLKLITDGLSSKEIGSRLMISSRTVEKHKKNLMEKTGTSNSILLVRYAIENKLI